MSRSNVWPFPSVFLLLLPRFLLGLDQFMELELQGINYFAQFYVRLVAETDPYDAISYQTVK